MVFSEDKGKILFPPLISGLAVILCLWNLQMGLAIGKAQKWWEKGLQPNMKEVTGAQDLVDSLLNAGDKLVVVDFFSPGCGGCRALHPKVRLSFTPLPKKKKIDWYGRPFKLWVCLICRHWDGCSVFIWADLSVGRDESRCWVPSGELWGA